MGGFNHEMMGMEQLIYMLELCKPQAFRRRSVSQKPEIASGSLSVLLASIPTALPCIIKF